MTKEQAIKISCVGLAVAFLLFVSGLTRVNPSYFINNEICQRETLSEVERIINGHPELTSRERVFVIRQINQVCDQVLLD